MGKTRSAYPPAFRRQMVELVQAGRTPEELSREFEPTAQSIWNWVAQSARDAGRGDGPLMRTNRGRITKRGRGHARGMLVEVAWVAVRVPGPLRAFFLRIRARRGQHVAAVASARKHRSRVRINAYGGGWRVTSSIVILHRGKT
jgi:transposase-like protein